MNQYLTFQRVVELLEEFQKQSPILNSFGFGNLIDFSRTVSASTVNYPYMFVVPLSINYGENITEYQVSIIFADILNYDLSNELGAVSDMSLEAKRFLSYIKRGINTFPQLYDNLDVILPTGAIPFMERFGDHTAGVALDCVLQIFEDLNACDFYPSPTPTAQPTSTPSMTPSVTPPASPSATPAITPTQTQTMTPSPTCPVTEQYLEVAIQSCNSFKLSLWNDPQFTSPANATCDLPVSGTAYGDLGTVYTGVEVIDNGQHQHNFNLNAVLQPGECVSGFTVHNVNTIGCTCPVQVNICQTFQLDNPTLFVTTWDYYDCSGVLQSRSVPFLSIDSICALDGTVTLVSGSGSISNQGDCKIT